MLYFVLVKGDIPIQLRYFLVAVYQLLMNVLKYLILAIILKEFRIMILKYSN